MRTGPSTPVTPCRLSLGGESFPPRRPVRPADNFLASRPAELFLQDVYGLNLGRAPHPNLPNRGGIVERLRRLGFTRVLQSESSSSRQDSTFVSAGGGSLLDGLRRNQSLPALIGAKPGKPSTSLHHPPAHPTTLAIPPPPWGNLKEKRRHLASRAPNTKS
uniref:Uncharacterized protein n=1 Tax=Neogobius melanostomus TaxID=47308 RepID=A0A8C6S313_9GOBI